MIVNPSNLNRLRGHDFLDLGDCWLCRTRTQKKKRIRGFKSKSRNPFEELFLLAFISSLQYPNMDYLAVAPLASVFWYFLGIHVGILDKAC